MFLGKWESPLDCYINIGRLGICLTNWRRRDLYFDYWHFEKKLDLGTFAHALSKVYQLPITQERVNDWSQNTWEEDVGSKIMTTQWLKINWVGQKISCNVAIKEHYYKLHHWWYWIPLWISRMFPGISASCRRCGWIECKLLAYVVGGLGKLWFFLKSEHRNTEGTGPTYPLFSTDLFNTWLVILVSYKLEKDIIVEFLYGNFTVDC